MVGTVIAAVLFGFILRTRFIVLFALGGMLILIAAGAMLLEYGTQSGVALRIAALGALGLGAGATVSPALFVSGLPLQASMLGRIFALIELVRSVADFVIAAGHVEDRTLGGKVLSVPNLDAWLNRNQAAIDSPPLLARWRRA